MQSCFFYGKRNFDKKPEIFVEISVRQVFYGNHGVVSAVLAFSRSFVFMLIAMLMLPHFLGVNGVWMATPAAELMALALSAGMFIIYRKRYQY